MVRVSRFTQASIAPIPLRVCTEQGCMTLNIPGPMNSVEIPGRRIVDLNIGRPFPFGIRIVADGEEYMLDEIDICDFDRIDAIIIFDGFLYGNGFLPGYTYRPTMWAGGQYLESGRSFIYPGQVNPYMGWY
jgi:hypothetical protein